MKPFYSLIITKPDVTEEQLYGSFKKARVEAEKRGLDYASLTKTGRERNDLKIVVLERKESDSL